MTDDQRLAEALRIGDKLQSEAARVVSWIEQEDVSIPYEVFMANGEIKSAVDQWTELRKAAANPSPSPSELEGMRERLTEILAAGHDYGYDLRGDIAAEFDIPTEGPQNIVASPDHSKEGQEHG